MLKKIFTVIAILVSFLYSDVTFDVTVNKNRAVKGETIVVEASVTLSGKDKNVPAPQIPPLPYYKVVGSTSSQQQSTSIQIINGKMQKDTRRTIDYIYTLKIIADTTFIFPAIELKGGSKVYKSKPITIVVGTAPPSKITSKAKGGNSLGDDVSDEDYVTVKVRSSKNSVYVGEQVVVSFDVIQKTRAPVQLDVSSFTDAVGNIESAFKDKFSISRLFEQNIAQRQTVINGYHCNVYTLSFAMVPLKSGSVRLTSVPFKYFYLKQIRTRDPFDDFFGGGFFGSTSVQKIPQTAYSNIKILNVKELPKPEPEGFSGSVGKFYIKSSIDKSSAKVGEGITFAYTLSGNSRPGNIFPIKIDSIPNFEFFTPEKHVYVDTTSTGIKSRKVFKYLMIPQTQGKIVFPAFSWVYFDPSSGSYKTLRTNEFHLDIVKGDGVKRGSTRYLSQTDIQQIGSDIRYIKTPRKLTTQNLKPYKDMWVVLLYPIPFLIVILSLLYRLQRKYFKTDEKKNMQKRAYSEATKKLKQLANENFEPADVANIVEDYLSKKFMFEASGKTQEELSYELKKKNISSEHVDNMLKLLQELDFMRFSGLSKSAGDGLVKKSLELISAIEKEVK